MPTPRPTTRPMVRFVGRVDSNVFVAHWLMIENLSQCRCPALASLREAITVARRQGAGLPRLRAAISLARQLAESGDIEDAYAVLPPACESIRERSELADVRTAHALLNDLTNR